MVGDCRKLPALKPKNLPEHHEARSRNASYNLDSSFLPNAGIPTLSKHPPRHEFRNSTGRELQPSTTGPLNDAISQTSSPASASHWRPARLLCHDPDAAPAPERYETLFGIKDKGVLAVKLWFTRSVCNDYNCVLDPGRTRRTSLSL